MTPGQGPGASVSRVLLLRHAMPVVDAALPAAQWPLSDAGRSAARALAGTLPRDGIRLTSPEPKARETLALACPGEAVTDARLGEVCRPAEPVGDGFRAVRRDWVAGRLDRRHRGWESPQDAAARFHAAVTERLPGTLVVATHGMVLTAWLVSIGHVESGELAARFWDGLALPDLVDVNLA